MQAGSPHAAISLWSLRLAAGRGSPSGCAGFQPRHQPVGHWLGAVWREHTGYRSVIVISFSVRFSRVENPHLESWSPGRAGSEQPMGWEELPTPPLARGTITLMPISQNNFRGPTSRDGPELELLGGLQHRRCQNFPGSCPAAGAGRQDAAQPGAGRAVPLCRVGIAGLCPQPCSCHWHQGWAQLSFQALN